MNEDTVISVRGLSKKYRLGMTLSYDTLRDQIAHGVKAAWNHIGHLFTKNGGPYGAQSSDGQQVHSKNHRQEFWALKDINFDIKRGEIVGVIGANGAGKSTLLKILSQITEPTEGEIRMRGRVGSLLEVGTGMHPELSGKENIYLNGAILGMTEREISRKYDQIVEFSGIQEFINTPIKRYSSGMRVRLGFSIAAHLDLEILMVDEVLAVGDALFQRKCLGKMKNVTQSGRTILFVSHNMAAISTLCSRVIVLDKGKIGIDCGCVEGIREYMTRIGNNNVEQNGTSKKMSRRGDGSVRIIHFKIMDADDRDVKSLIGGYKYRFCFKVEASQIINWKHVEVGFSLATSDGIDVCSFDTLLTGDKCNFARDTCHFECVIDNFPLVEGRYVILARTLHNGVHADWIDNLATIDVYKGSIFKTGKHPLKGMLMVPHNWILGAEEKKL